MVALSDVTRAEAALADFARETRGTARSFDQQCDLDDRFCDLAVEFNRALIRLMRVPAPDLEGFGLKVMLAVDHEAATLTDGEEAMAQLKADARRFAWHGGERRRG
ncbi:MAG: hypothetical protein ACJ8DZ_01505 [Allosphingosinicella sp.]